MARTTTQLRGLWAPHCAGPWATISLHGEGRISVRASVVDAFLALNKVLVAFDYLTRRADTGAYNCRRITGGTGWSLHAYGIAADLNWSTNPYGKRLVTDMPRAMVDAILRIRTNSGEQVFRWGGDYSGNRDAMHFEVVASPAAIASGIDPSTVVGGRQAEAIDWAAVRRLVAGTTYNDLGRFRYGTPEYNRAVQTALNIVSGSKLETKTGIWGPKSKEACRLYQLYVKLRPATGTPGIRTCRDLRKALLRIRDGKA